MSQIEWQECQALTKLLKMTDAEVKQTSEKLEALHTRRLLIKRNLTEQVQKAI